MALPMVEQNHIIGQIGVSICEQTFLEHSEWIFRAGGVLDCGVDAQIELVQNREASGRVIALQIKTGSSFFGETNADGYVFRGAMKHYYYWLNHSLPVILVLCCEKQRKLWWVEVTRTNTTLTEKAWKITVPFSNCLSDKKQFHYLKNIAVHNKNKELTESAIYKLICERYKGIYILQEFEVPRELHWYKYVGELNDELIPISYIHNPITGVDEDDLKEHIRLKDCNKRVTGASKVIILLIETSKDRLKNATSLVEKYQGDDIDYVVCVYDANGELTEYVNGNPVGFYDHHYGGKPWLSDW